MSESYAAALSGRLMAILDTGVHDVDGIAAGLAGGDVLPETGGPWSAKTLERELRRLAPTPPKPALRGALLPPYDAARGIPSAQPRARENGETPDEPVERLLRDGLRNQWYLVAASAEVTDRPLGVVRCGERLVLWRDADGQVHAVEDRCPHRGAALSVGEIVEGLLTCAYHGVRVDEYGKAVVVPGYPGCPLEGKTLIKHFPVVEHYQAIWAWFGDDAHRTPEPLVLPEELTSDEWSGMLHYDTWTGDYRFVWDNLCDPMHGPYLHGRTYMQSRGVRQDEVVVQEKPGGFEVFRAGQRGVNFDWMEVCDAGTSLYARVEIAFPPSAGPGGPLQVIFYTTPAESGMTRVGVWRLRKVSGWQRDLWHLLFDQRIRTLTDAVLAQDKVALATMPPWPAREHLYQHDAGLTRIRKLMREKAKAQARGLVEAV